MHSSRFAVPVAALLLCAAPLAAQPAPPPRPPGAPSAPSTSGASYETTVTLRAGDILQPALLSTPLYRVRDQVVTSWGVNTFVIESTSYGPFVARGNIDLLERIAEIGAMKRMDDMMLTEEYREAKKKAYKREREAAEDFVPAAGDFVDNDPKGVGKFFHRVGQALKDDDNPGKADDYQDYVARSTRLALLAKLDLAQKLGINPYSTNPKLKQKLEEMSRALGIGGYKMTPGPATASTSGAAAVLMKNQLTPAMASLIYSKSPAELRALLQDTLLQMGVSAKDALALLSNPAFTPWTQTQFVISLEQLVGVTGRDLLVRTAALTSTEESDALFYAQTARLLAWLATQNYAIDRIERKSNAYCILRDGTLLLALSWDYARWSESAERCATWLQSIEVNGRKPPSITLAITGVASPRCRDEMEARGIKLLDRLDRGPLN